MLFKGTSKMGYCIIRPAADVTARKMNFRLCAPAILKLWCNVQKFVSEHVTSGTVRDRSGVEALRARRSSRKDGAFPEKKKKNSPRLD